MRGFRASGIIYPELGSELLRWSPRGYPDGLDELAILHERLMLMGRRKAADPHAEKPADVDQEELTTEPARRPSMAL